MINDIFDEGYSYDFIEDIEKLNLKENAEC